MVSTSMACELCTVNLASKGIVKIHLSKSNRGIWRVKARWTIVSFVNDRLPIPPPRAFTNIETCSNRKKALAIEYATRDCIIPLRFEGVQVNSIEILRE
ncbi:hypothetical protein [Nitrospira sp. KM1]|uniref:hypothetical protein n=1 Tax=Nitrospira sp. KM1 TaxID=1936990 RepID=UPI00156650FA|nr:hypothetical protein [Nitrospira sp. KM1]